MGSFFLEKGLVIRREGQVLEYSSRWGDEIYFEGVETGKRINLSETQFWYEYQIKSIEVIDAFSSPSLLLIAENKQEPTLLQDLEAIPNKYQIDYERKITYISLLKKSGISRGQKRLIKIEVARISEEISDKCGTPGTSTISKWWRDLDKAQGDFYAIVNRNALKKRTTALDNESEEFLRNHIDNCYFTDKRKSISRAYTEYEGKIDAENLIRKQLNKTELHQASERTYANRIYARPKEEIMIARLGRQAARKHFRMVKGHLWAENPLDVVEIDHTPMNLFVIDDHAFLPLGRPWLTAIKDRYSGVLLGFYISFQATGLQSVFGAIKHSLSSHHYAYELWPEIENPWPSFGRGMYYESDRGGDFQSQRYRNAIMSLGAMYEYSPRRTPWLKGSIERFFLTLEQMFFEAMPGRTYASIEKRGDYNSKKDAVIRFSTLVFLLHKWAADYHNVFPNKRDLARPLDLWMDGIQTAPPPYPCSIDELNLILGEHHSGKLSHEGLRYSWLTYADDQLQDLMKDCGKGIELEFVVSPENLGVIYVLDPRKKSYFEVPCTRPEYANGLSMFQHKYLRKEASIQLEKSSAVDTLINTRARIQEVIGGELEKKKNAGKAQFSRLAGINSNAVLEQQERTILTPFAGQDTNPVVQEMGPTFTNVPKFTWGE